MLFLTVLGAVALDLLCGDPPNRWHPVAWMGLYIRALWRRRPGKRLPRRRHRPGGEAGRRAALSVFGAALVLSGMALFGLPWLLAARLKPPCLWLWSMPLLKVTLAVQGLLVAGKRVQEALEQGDLEQARKHLGRDLVSRPTAGLSAPLTAAAAVESLAENLTDGVTGPLFYFALFGLPGAWAYRFINTSDSMLGYRQGDYEHGGKAAALLDTAANWLPARLTGALVTAAASLAGENAAGAWRVMREQHGRTASRNAGWTMAAAAGALGVRLEKVGCYRLEGGENLPGVRTLGRALRLVRWAAVLIVVMCLALTGAVHALFG